MKAIRLLSRLLRDRSGVSSTEFALVGTAAISMIMGAMYIAMLGFTASSLRYATEQAARCAAVNTTVCTNATTTQAYAATQFRNVSGSAASFTATTETCGSQVTGSVSVGMKLSDYRLVVPLSAQACFP